MYKAKGFGQEDMGVKIMEISVIWIWDNPIACCETMSCVKTGRSFLL